MKKYIAAALILIVLIACRRRFAFFHFFNGGSWQGTWWGVQDAGVNMDRRQHAKPGNRYIYQE